LNRQGYNNLYVDGGGAIQSFLKEDLIDEMIITLIPVILGSGFSLFNQFDNRIYFRHYRTEIYNNALVKIHYIRDR